MPVGRRLAFGQETSLGIAMMCRLIRVAGPLLALVFSVQAFAADTATHLKGLWLTTDYPSLAARAGDSTTVKLKLQNYGLPPQRVTRAKRKIQANRIPYRVPADHDLPGRLPEHARLVSLEGKCELAAPGRNGAKASPPRRSLVLRAVAAIGPAHVAWHVTRAISSVLE